MTKFEKIKKDLFSIQRLLFVSGCLVGTGVSVVGIGHGLNKLTPIFIGFGMTLVAMLFATRARKKRDELFKILQHEVGTPVEKYSSGYAEVLKTAIEQGKGETNGKNQDDEN